MGRIIKDHAFTCIFLIAVFYIWFSWNYLPWDHKTAENHLNRSFDKRLETGETQISLQDLTDFEWDKVCFIGAEEQYVSRHISWKNHSVENIIGKPYDGYYPDYTCDSGGHNDLFFLWENEPVRVIAFKYCGLTPAKNSFCFGKNAYIRLLSWPHKNYSPELILEE